MNAYTNSLCRSRERRVNQCWSHRSSSLSHWLNPRLPIADERIRPSHRHRRDGGWLYRNAGGHFHGLIVAAWFSLDEA
jgi:hypothetical protein